MSYLYRLIRRKDRFIYGRKGRFSKDAFHPNEGKYLTKRALMAVLKGDESLKDTCNVEIFYITSEDERLASEFLIRNNK